MFVQIKPLEIRKAGNGYTLHDGQGAAVAYARDLQIARSLSVSVFAIDHALDHSQRIPPGEKCKVKDCPQCAVMQRIVGLEIVR